MSLFYRLDDINIDELHCTSDEMKELISGTITQYQQDDVYTVFVKNKGIYCYGDTLSAVVKRCKAITAVLVDHYVR